MREGKLEGEGLEKKMHDKKGKAATGADAVDDRWCGLVHAAAVYNINNIMIAAGFICDARVTKNGVIETFESHV